MSYSDQRDYRMHVRRAVAWFAKQPDNVGMLEGDMHDKFCDTYFNGRFEAGRVRGGEDRTRVNRIGRVKMARWLAGQSPVPYGIIMALEGVGDERPEGY